MNASGITEDRKPIHDGTMMPVMATSAGIDSASARNGPPTWSP
jgi:hypothetical protein